MSLYEDLGKTRDVVSEIDDDVKDVMDTIKNNRCETVEEYEDLLSDIKGKLDNIRGRLY